MTMIGTVELAPAPIANGPAELLRLRRAAAVRERCARVHDWVAAGRSSFFTLDESRLPQVAADVAAVTRAAYPDLVVPYHSRWRHFSAGGVDRWQGLAAHFTSPLDRARAALDLATVSVLLDAGAGPAWRWREPSTGLELARSEGLAVASLELFRSGAFSSNAADPWRVDACALVRLDAADLAAGFQVSADNPLVGLEGRAELLRRLGRSLLARPDVYGGAPARPGHLLDTVRATWPAGAVAASDLLAILLDTLSPMWPSGLVVDGVAIGDAGLHPAAATGDVSSRIVPFHKLSQWLTYSLVEPLEDAGLVVGDVDGLTALSEYRNGGLLIDHGVIVPRRPLDDRGPLPVGSEPVVEWRALTVVLMDRLLPPVRAALGLGEAFTLAHMLEGGTWAAGRRIARTARPPDGPPPLAIAADGTVF